MDYFCQKHKKYKGRRIPTNQCVDCLNLYLKLHNKPRVPVKPSITFKDKSKYTRKVKNNKIKGIS